MKQKLLPVLAAAILFAACNNEKKEDKKETTGTETEVKEKEWKVVDSATAMKAWMDYATPGDVHKMISGSDGAWNAEVTNWMAEGAPPTTTMATANNKMIMDGRYQVTEFSGEMMGMPFNGMGILSYDNYKKTFTNVWIDNMGTGIMSMEGQWDDATKSMTLTGKYTNPANGMECEMKEVFTMTDNDNQKMEMWGPDQTTGKQYKTMEIKFTRRK
ncbi:MAG: DUF1579 domain-containing protein [Bacteroidota bacterium]